jgi:hypothetical protein
MTGHVLCRVRRPNGTEYVLRLELWHLQSLMNAANDHFGTSRELIGGPRLEAKAVTGRKGKPRRP